MRSILDEEEMIVLDLVQDKIKKKEDYPTRTVKMIFGDGTCHGEGCSSCDGTCDGSCEDTCTGYGDGDIDPYDCDKM